MAEKKTVLVTGAAGFIGFHLCAKLLKEGHTVVGIDNLNPYYDVNLKKSRLNILQGDGSFRFYQADLVDKKTLFSIFEEHAFRYVVNLAAQAGVRYSLKNPQAYVSSNLEGFVNILEACRAFPPLHLVYASSSSVYGGNKKVPFSVHDNVDHPVSIYAASKKANELMAHSYASLFNLPTTGLRFFTVYGPWGRPDMALFIFTKGILEGKPIQVFNNGQMERDFTYIDDIVEGIVRLIPRPPKPNPNWEGTDPSTSSAPYKVYNIGNNKPVSLLRFIEVIEDALGKKAVKEMAPLQDGDVPATFADIEDLVRDTGYKPCTPVEDGVRKFVDWYLDFYNINLERK